MKRCDLTDLDLPINMIVLVSYFTADDGHDHHQMIKPHSSNGKDGIKYQTSSVVGEI